jgi:hypothetical protein
MVISLRTPEKINIDFGKSIHNVRVPYECLPITEKGKQK